MIRSFDQFQLYTRALLYRYVTGNCSTLQQRYNVYLLSIVATEALIVDLIDKWMDGYVVDRDYCYGIFHLCRTFLPYPLRDGHLKIRHVNLVGGTKSIS